MEHLFSSQLYERPLRSPPVFWGFFAGRELLSSQQASPLQLVNLWHKAGQRTRLDGSQMA